MALRFDRERRITAISRGAHVFTPAKFTASPTSVGAGPQRWRVIRRRFLPTIVSIASTGEPRRSPGTTRASRRDLAEFNEGEIASALGSGATARRDWDKARVLLREALT
jgi:hypothetical protein